MKIGVIAAMDNEAAYLKGRLENAHESSIAGATFAEGTLEGIPAVVARSGVGKVNAALCVQLLVDRFAVTHVVNTGVAGSLDARIDIGDLVVSTDAVQHDMDVTYLGYEPGQVPQMDQFSFAADADLRARIVQAAAAMAPEIGVYEGRVASGDRFICEDADKQLIASRFGALCCEMEGAAIAQACVLNGVPFVIVRAISDKADGSQTELYQEFEDKAAEHCAHIVERVFSDLR